jgi:predicted O-linked N-acetylglucosamine transferase (SPINDLY family)
VSTPGRSTDPLTLEQAHQLALDHHRAGRLAEAEALYRQILAQDPDQPHALHLLGVLAGQVGQTDAAIDLIGRAIAVAPAIPEFHSSLGRVLWGNGRLTEAIAALGRVAALRPDDAAAHHDLGVTLNEVGRLAEAISAFGRAIALQPDMAGAHANLGNAFKSQGRLDEAIAAYNHATALRPEVAEIHSNLGLALWQGGRLDEAVVALNRALALRPELAEAYGNLGNVYRDQGRHDEALACFRKAVELDPECALTASSLLVTLHYHPDHDAEALLSEHRAWARRFAVPLAAQIRPHDNDRTPDRRLKVGFLSPDLRAHPVGRSLLPWFTARDRGQIEIVCYSDVQRGDDITCRLQALADRWHSTAGLGDAHLAEQIRTDRIDILVDPTLHTAHNRMLVFARKPAPIQLTMLGPPTTTGLETMDYRLTDPFLDPPGATDDDYTERSIRLPHCFWSYLPPDENEAPPVGELPARENGFVTFGCLNQFAKVTGPALELWIRILKAVPTARLLIQAHPGGYLDPVRARFEREGITGDRLVFAANLPRHQYFQRYGTLDLSLDPFPYNGHTSTLDSLWMGVPVITLAGRTGMGRGGVSLLSNAGLPEFIARRPEEYVDLAVRWAGDLTALAALRATLRERMLASPMLDGPQFAADVQAIFRQVWIEWCGR